MDSALRLHPGQQKLTPAQEAEARRFADERIAAQLSTEPVDEQEAEAFLRQAYQVANLPPPTRIHWLDGPVQFVAIFLPKSVWDRVWDRVEASTLDNVRQSVWDSIDASALDNVRASFRRSFRRSVEANAWDSVWTSVGASVEASVWDHVSASVETSIEASVGASVEASVRHSVWTSVGASVEASVRHSVWDRVRDVIMGSVRAYYEAPRLAFYHFFAIYLAPNELEALAHFNELVSGYWLGHEVAVLVRRPHLLSRDTADRLHNATGKCVEYRDGWGFYAWHGLLVPEQVIMTPERLSREDFLNEPNLEMRRIIQERMGSRFVAELRGRVLDTGPRGTLYEVALPDDPERVARYVQVQDASTARQYFLRVPPWIQTAAKAVAWSFRLSVEEYGPVQET